MAESLSQQNSDEQFLASLPEGMADEILTMRCWLCRTAIGVKDDEPRYTDPYDFPICDECKGKKIFPREHVWSVMEGLRSTQRHTARQREKLKAALDAKDAEIAESVPVSVLREHSIYFIECDEVQKRDKPHCYCAQVDLGWYPTVGAAVEAHLVHLQAVAGEH